MRATPRGQRRDDERIGSLILLNGPPGVGKSTVARRYAESHPLTLVVEVDTIRSSLGGWREEESSKGLARTHALALAETHLREGHDVVVPQYLGRLDFILELDRLAARLGAPFVEVVLLDESDRVAARFRERRAQFASAEELHPEGDIDDDAIDDAIDEAIERLQDVVAARPRAHVLQMQERVEDSCSLLEDAVGAAGDTGR